MGKVAEQATLTFSGIDTSHLSAATPLEEQARAVWLAAQHALKAKHAEHTIHNGKPGLKGELVMKQIVNGLFARESKANQETINNLTGHVLRRIQAAVCVRRPDGPRDSSNGARGEYKMPVWFIADTMPEDLVVVARYIHSRHSSGDLAPPGMTREPGPAEQAVIHDGHRKDWLSDKELGVDRDPAPVQVRHVEPASAQEQPRGGHPGEAFGLTPEQTPTPPTSPADEQARPLAYDTQGPPGENKQQRMKRLHQETLDMILDILVRYAPQPLIADEVGLMLPKHPDTLHDARRTSVAREGLAELQKMGLVYSRKETPSEIRMRVGPNRSPMGARPRLYSTSTPVPGRTVKNVIGDAIQMRIERGELAPTQANGLQQKHDIPLHLQRSRQTFPEGGRPTRSHQRQTPRRAQPDAQRTYETPRSASLEALLREPPAEWKSTRRKDADRREKVLAAMRREPMRRWRQCDIGELFDVASGHATIRRVMAPLVRDGIVSLEGRRFKLLPVPKQPERTSKETPTVPDTMTAPAPAPTPVFTPAPTPASIAPHAQQHPPRDPDTLVEDELVASLTPEVRRIVELIVQLQRGDESETARLKQRVTEQDREITRLRRANTGLTNALHAMQDPAEGDEGEGTTS